MLLQHVRGPTAGPVRFDDQSVVDGRLTAVGQVGGDGEPLAQLRVGQARQAGSVLVVAAIELDVVQDDPVVRRKELGEGGQPREEVGLVDRAQPAGWREFR